MDRQDGPARLDPPRSGRPRSTAAIDLVNVLADDLPVGDAGDARGRLRGPAGDRVPSGLVVDDPRWTRPLPWTLPIVHTIGARRSLAMVALALVNVEVPIAILWLAGRRRPWTLRLLLALPVAAAVPLAVFQTIEPLLPVELASQPVSSRTAFVVATLAGVPIVTYAAAFLFSLARARLRRLGVLLGLTLVASAIAAAGWIWFDRRTMPALEHYGRSGRPLALGMGAYATGILVVLGWPVGRFYRWLKRPRQIAGGAM
jgi:hypothetical protein